MKSNITSTKMSEIYMINVDAKMAAAGAAAFREYNELAVERYGCFMSQESINAFSFGAAWYAGYIAGKQAERRKNH